MIQGLPGARKVRDCTRPGEMVVEFVNEPGVRWRAKLTVRGPRKLVLLVRDGQC